MLEFFLACLNPCAGRVKSLWPQSAQRNAAKVAKKSRGGRVDRRLLSCSTWQRPLVRRRVLSSHFPGL